MENCILDTIEPIINIAKLLVSLDWFLETDACVYWLGDIPECVGDHWATAHSEGIEIMQNAYEHLRKAHKKFREVIK